jgi:Lipase (class 3)
MKIIFYLTAIFCLSFFFSCGEDAPTNSTVGNPIVQGYDQNESSQCMTLSALAYVNENDPQYIKDSLLVQLSITSYATQGKWKLVWGPGLNSDYSNMMFVVKDTTTEPNRYAIAVRGTDWCYFFDWKEDASAIEFDAYPYGESGDSVSHGALYGLNQLLAMRDPVTNQTLVSYLNSISASSNLMYITGHSLGGQLATILSSWFLDNGYSSKFKLKSYTYAAPSTGNETYVQHFAKIFEAANAESHRVVNSNDLVPNFCATLESVLINQIPTTVPKSVEGVIFGLDVYLIKYDLIYKNVGTEYNLGTISPDSCSYTPGSIDQYACWVAYEHHTNTYLTLLNAPPVNYYTAACDWSTK